MVVPQFGYSRRKINLRSLKSDLKSTPIYSQIHYTHRTNCRTINKNVVVNTSKSYRRFSMENPSIPLFNQSQLTLSGSQSQRQRVFATPSSSSSTDSTRSWKTVKCLTQRQLFSVTVDELPAVVVWTVFWLLRRRFAGLCLLKQWHSVWLMNVRYSTDGSRFSIVETWKIMNIRVSYRFGAGNWFYWVKLTVNFCFEFILQFNNLCAVNLCSHLCPTLYENDFSLMFSCLYFSQQKCIIQLVWINIIDSTLRRLHI